MLIRKYASWQAEPFLRAKVKIAYFFPDKQRRDPDNYAGAAKNIMDAIVARGLLPDDNFKYVEELAVSGQVDKHNPRVEIVLEGE